MYNIETMAKLCGVSRRTVRYYVQKGLLKPPEGGGRGSYYTDKHIMQLKQIQELAEQGVPLIHMKSHLAGKATAFPEKTTLPPLKATVWERHLIKDGVEIHFRPGKLTYDELHRIKKVVKQSKGEEDD